MYCTYTVPYTVLSPIGNNLGLSVSPKDTMADKEVVFEPPTDQSLANPNWVSMYFKSSLIIREVQTHIFNDKRPFLVFIFLCILFLMTTQNNTVIS